MKLKSLLSITALITLTPLAWADNSANPLQAKVVQYKNEPTYHVEIIQTQEPKLNKELANFFCDFAWGNESDIADCKKMDIEKGIEQHYQWTKNDTETLYFSQKYKYLNQNDKKYFQACIMEREDFIKDCKIYDISNLKQTVLLDKENIPMIDGMGVNSRHINVSGEKYFLSCLNSLGTESCDLYSLKNPQKPVYEGSINAFLSEEQINKIASFYLAYGDYFNDKLEPKCQKAIAKQGIRLNTTDKISDTVKKQCSAKVIEEIDYIDRNDGAHKISLYKHDKDAGYTINFLTWVTFRGRWGYVDVPDEKTLETLIPRHLWSVFMGK